MRHPALVLTRFALLSALFSAVPVARLTAQEAPDRVTLSAAVDSMAKAELATGRVAALSIAVARRGEVLLERGMGWRTWRTRCRPRSGRSFGSARSRSSSPPRRS